MVALVGYPLNSAEEAAATKELVKSSTQSARLPSHVTIDSVLKLVAENPGASCLSYFTLKRIWVALCSYISDQLLKVKGVTVPGFAALSFRKIKVNRGNWGEKLELLPTFTLLPNFCAAFSLSTSRGVSLAASGTVAGSSANISAIAIKAGVAKDACNNALKDICRKFGDIAAKGGNFTVDFGVARLSFRSQKCEAQWNSTFLRHIERHCSNVNNKALRKVWKGGSSQKTYESDTLAPRDVDLSRAEESPHQQSYGLPSPHTGTAMPQYPQSDRPESRVSSRPSSAGPMRGRMSKQSLTNDDDGSISQVRAHLNNALAFARSDPPSHPEAHPADQTPTAAHREPSPATLDRLYQADDREPSQEMANQKYANRLRNKAAYRRMRNKAYVVAWEEQKRARVQQLRIEKENDARRMLIAREQEEVQKQRTADESRDRKVVAKRVQADNLTTCKRQHRPEAPPVGDTYWGRFEHISPHRTGDRIREKIEALQSQKRDRAQANREEDLKAFELKSAQWQEEERCEKEKKLRDRSALQSEYQAYVKSKETRAAACSPHVRLQYSRNPASIARDRDDTDHSGNFFFKSRTAQQMAEDERHERNTRRTAAVEVQRENQLMVEQGNKKKKLNNGLKKYSDKRHIDRSIKIEMEMEDDDHLVLRKQQKELRKIWDGQIQEKKSNKVAERERERNVATMHAWRNESSDEEYDDFPKQNLLSPSIAASKLA